MLNLIIDSGAIWFLVAFGVIMFGCWLYSFCSHNTSASGPKELPPEYSIDNVIFNEYSRMAKITVIETTKYRVVVKYKQINYKKYPIYSNYYKERTKTINKTIRLLNSDLEALPLNSDPLISKNAEFIVSSIPNQNLHPSWYKKNILKTQFEKTQDHLENLKKQQQDLLDKTLSEYTKKLNSIKANLEILEKRFQKSKDKKYNCERKINTIKHKGKKISIFFQRKYNKINENYVSVSNRLESMLKFFENTELEKQQLSVAYLNSIGKLKNKIEDAKKAFLEESQHILPLPTLETINKPEHVFNPLSFFYGLTYSKIAGCYVIRNTENGKCYVGQSKDVMRRIKQHFNGTRPKNDSFFDDYYSSSYINKNDLFEFTILSCRTDELNKKEKELIAQYDAYDFGYNKTHGNSK